MVKKETGKTLAAFLWALDHLYRLGLDGRLEERVYVVYVSPLKALNNAAPLGRLPGPAAEELMVSVKTKRIYDPKAPGDGMRVLVMRLWPRGIKKSRVDMWLKELGAEIPLIKAWKSGKVTSWPAFRRRYLAGLKKPAAQAQLKELKTLARKGRVTLLCACPDESRCHRGLLKRLIA